MTPRFEPFFQTLREAQGGTFSYAWITPSRIKLAVFACEPRMYWP